MMPGGLCCQYPFGQSRPLPIGVSLLLWSFLILVESVQFMASCLLPPGRCTSLRTNFGQTIEKQRLWSMCLPACFNLICCSVALANCCSGRVSQYLTSMRCTSQSEGFLARMSL